MLALVSANKTTFATKIISTHEGANCEPAIEALARLVAADNSTAPWTVRYPLAKYLDRDVLRVSLVDYIDTKNPNLMAENGIIAISLVNF